MAEINIQRKKKTVWLWVILVLVMLAGAMVWYWKYYENNPENDNAVPNSTGFRQASSTGVTASLGAWALESKDCLPV